MKCTAFFASNFNKSGLTDTRLGPVLIQGRMREFDVVGPPSIDFQHDVSGGTLPECSMSFTIQMRSDRRGNDDGSQMGSGNIDDDYLTGGYGAYVALFMDDTLIATQCVSGIGFLSNGRAQIDTKSIYLLDSDKERGGFICQNAPLSSVLLLLNYVKVVDNTHEDAWTAQPASGEDALTGTYIAENSVKDITVYGYIPFTNVHDIIQQLVLVTNTRPYENKYGQLVLTKGYKGTQTGIVPQLSTTYPVTRVERQVQPRKVFASPVVNALGHVSKINVLKTQILERLPHENTDEELVEPIGYVNGTTIHVWSSSDDVNKTYTLHQFELTYNTTTGLRNIYGDTVSIDSTLIPPSNSTDYFTNNEMYDGYGSGIQHESLIGKTGYEISFDVIDDEFELMRGGWLMLANEFGYDYFYNSVKGPLLWGTVTSVTYTIGKHAKASVTMVGRYDSAIASNTNRGKYLTIRSRWQDAWMDEPVTVGNGHFYPPERT